MATQKLIGFRRHERGVTMLETAILAACIAVVAMAGVAKIGQETRGTFETVGNKMAGTGGIIIPGNGICEQGEEPPC